MIRAVAREGNLKLMACDVQLLAQICCSHLFCLASLKHSHSSSNKRLKRSCLHLEMLTLLSVIKWIDSVVEMLRQDSHGWISHSVRSKVGLINAVFHLVEVVCHNQSKKINHLFAVGLSFQITLTYI